MSGLRRTGVRAKRPEPPAASAEARVRALESELARAKARAAAVERELARAEAEIADLRAHLQTVISSTSWKLTAPLRVVIRLMTGRQPMRPLLQRVAPGLAGRAEGALARLRARRAAKAAKPRVRPEPKPASFPLAGALAVLPELTGAAREPLPVSVSVIVPTFNAGHEFFWMLRKYRAQRGLKAVEIVVVDSGSTDGTPELAESLGCKVVRIPQADFSHSYARNLGADHASGDLFLFTVQDAYPVGENWLHTLARALLHPADPEQKLAALSCAEFPRVDSELIYNAAVDVHSRFLGCHDADRVGAFAGEDHMALRTQGQLSDLACLIPAETFRKYRYEGRYAEDLILGVRLIRDGHKAAMLSSVKIIHSHNRSAAYHLKRTFVDVIFLTDGFPDFIVPPVGTVTGVWTGVAALKALTAAWRSEARNEAGPALRTLAARARGVSLTGRKAPEPADFGVPGLGEWLRSALAAEGTRGGAADARDLVTIFADRLELLASFVERTYGRTDDYLLGEIDSAVEKTLAASAGAQLAAYYLTHSGEESGERAGLKPALRDLLLAGV